MSGSGPGVAGDAVDQRETNIATPKKKQEKKTRLHPDVPPARSSFKPNDHTTSSRPAIATPAWR
jgi:hypothetical protein